MVDAIAGYLREDADIVPMTRGVPGTRFGKAAKVERHALRDKFRTDVREVREAKMGKESESVRRAWRRFTESVDGYVPTEEELDLLTKSEAGDGAGVPMRGGRYRLSGVPEGLAVYAAENVRGQEPKALSFGPGAFAGEPPKTIDVKVEW